MARAKKRTVYPESYYRHVAEEYIRIVSSGTAKNRVYSRLARELSMPKSKMHNHVYQARKRGYLAPVTRTKPDPTPGVKMLPKQPVVAAANDDMVMPKMGDAWTLPKGIRVMSLDDDGIRFIDAGNLIFIK